jgi:hypothetical protein
MAGHSFSKRSGVSDYKDGGGKKKSSKVFEECASNCPLMGWGQKKSKKF